MELLPRWLDKHEREPEEASPLGIILCTGKKRDKSNYWNWTSQASTSLST